MLLGVLALVGAPQVWASAPAVGGFTVAGTASNLGIVGNGTAASPYFLVKGDSLNMTVSDSNPPKSEDLVGWELYVQFGDQPASTTNVYSMGVNNFEICSITVKAYYRNTDGQSGDVSEQTIYYVATYKLSGFFYFDNTAAEWDTSDSSSIYMLVDRRNVNGVDSCWGFKMTPIANTKLYSCFCPTEKYAGCLNRDGHINLRVRFAHMNTANDDGKWCAGNSYDLLLGNPNNLGATGVWEDSNLGTSTSSSSISFPNQTDKQKHQGNYRILVSGAGVYSNNTFIDLVNADPKRENLQNIFQAVYNGSSYVEPTNSMADIGFRDSYYFNDAEHCIPTPTNTVQNKGNTYNRKFNQKVGYSAPATIYVSNIQEGYVFEGWYDGDTRLTTEAEYTIYPTSEMNFTARFAKGTTLTLNSVENADHGYATYCCDSNFTVSGATAYKAKQNHSTGNLSLEPLTGVIPAGTGVILVGGKGALVNIIYTTANSEADVSDNELGGTTARTAVASIKTKTNFYAFNKNTNEFQLYGGEYMPAKKAYYQNGNPIQAPSIRMDFDEVGTATDVEKVAADEKTVKFFEKGQLFIRKDGIVYDMLGRVIR